MKKKGKKRDFNLREEYKENWDYIKESKNFIYLIIAVFFVFAFVGFFIPVPDAVAEQILHFIQELLEKIQGMNQNELISFIFFNNLQSSFFVMVFGVFLGIFPVVGAILNGYLLGFVASMGVGEGGVSVLLRLLPHGIFELPAVFISLGMGLRLGSWLIIEPIKFYWKKNKWIVIVFVLFYLPTLLITLIYDNKFKIKMKKSFHEFRESFPISLKTFVLIVIPLLILAAIIEGSFMFFSG